MSETGKNIVDGFRQLREKFCGNASVLFMTADQMMKEAGWSPIPRTGVYGNLSGAVDAPGLWLPTEFFRYYKNSKAKHFLPYIAILLDDPYKENQSVIEQALLSAGWIDYGTGNECKNWEYWYCRCHLWTDDREYDGKMYKHKPKNDWDEPSVFAAKATSFAHPLDKITSSAILKEKVVEPLLKEIS
jgi:hypothetical protein